MDRQILVSPQTLKGFRDYLPADMAARDHAVERIKRVYERFAPRKSTPHSRTPHTLLGGRRTGTFRLESPEEEPVAMRFDLTVPLLASRRSTAIGEAAVRRYHRPCVPRGQTPARGVTGSSRSSTSTPPGRRPSPWTRNRRDHVRAMRAVGLDTGEFRVRINNRKIVGRAALWLRRRNIATHKHLRVVDKLRKWHRQRVPRTRPGRIDDSGDPIPGVKLEPSTIDRLVKLFRCRFPVTRRSRRCARRCPRRIARWRARRNDETGGMPCGPGRRKRTQSSTHARARSRLLHRPVFRQNFRVRRSAGP